MDILDKSSQFSTVLNKSYYIRSNVIVTSLMFGLFYFIAMKLFINQNIISEFSNREFIITLILFTVWYSIVKYGSDFIIYKI